ncbi:NOT transcription complex subunit like [Forsythia ovata]|uniref:NOT transcription complex subunit like n=1 Tax=Forsythia ovata TaxID=205694 RepID=A0ABD1W1F2_9LAMI
MLRLNLNSAEHLDKAFAPPCANEPANLEPEYSIPKCYNARQPPALKSSAYGSLPGDMVPLVKTSTYKRGCYFIFFPNTSKLFWSRCFPNTILPNVGNTGCIANSVTVGKLVGGGNLTRGLSSAGVANLA